MRIPSHEVRTVRDREAIRAFQALREHGDRRVLWRSVDGELRLYRRAELGYDRRHARQMLGLPGLVACTILMATALAIGASVLVSDLQRHLGALVPLAIAGIGTAWSACSVIQELVARHLRRLRHIPQPTPDGR